jgi:DNA replication protein DnaC
MDSLVPALKRLRLSGVLDSLDVRNQQALSERWSYVEFLDRLLADEVERRAAKQLALRLRRGQVDTTKTLETYDFTFNPSLNRWLLHDLATCAYIRLHKNALIVGQTGVGKTHIAQALSHEAARRGFDVLFTSAHRMLLALQAARAEGHYERRLAAYLKPDLLVLDDVGLRPLPRGGADDLYDVIDGRYEKKSLVLTSNREPAEWSEMFANPLLANATLDRLLDRAAVLTITGRSYRLAGRGPATSTTTESSAASTAADPPTPSAPHEKEPPATDSTTTEHPLSDGQDRSDPT